MDTMTTATCDTTSEPTTDVAPYEPKVDDELRRLVPPLTDFERDTLEAQLLRDGHCLMPLIVWEGHRILLDGHHRKEICERLNLEGTSNKLF